MQVHEDDPFNHLKQGYSHYTVHFHQNRETNTPSQENILNINKEQK